MVNSTLSKNSIGVVGACWYLKPKRFLSLADNFVSQLVDCDSIHDRFVLMKDSLFGLEASGDDFSDWLIGDGDFLDISAYKQACETLPTNLPLYLIFNDTLFTKHPWRLICKCLFEIRDSLESISIPSLSAEFHPSTDLVLLDSNNPSRHHFSTFCLLLNNEGFKLFLRVLGELPVTSSPETVRAWIEEKLLMYPTLKPILHVHLFGPNSPWSWKSASSKLLQRKAVTVIFEYLLTVELLNCGVGMPINHGLWYKLRSRLGRYG